MATPRNPPDLLIHLSRRGLWVALVLILLLGANCLVVAGFPGTVSAEVARGMGAVTALAISIGVGSVQSAIKRAGVNPADPKNRALINDELRQAALNLAYRNGFFAMLTIQAPLALIETAAPPANPLGMMVGVTLLTGVVVMLSSVLYHDR